MAPQNDTKPACHPERSEGSCEAKDLMSTKDQIMTENHYYVYILTNWNNKVMYVGVTGNLQRRLYEHKNDLFEGFTKKYRVHKLVYYEETSEVYSAISREKQLKGLLRSKKNALVETMNPDWHDLSEDWE